MSLWFYLTMPGAKIERKHSGIFVRENGSTVEISREQWDDRNPGHEPCVVKEVDGDTDTVFGYNVTHNLGTMAVEAGIYLPLWRPDELHITKAAQLIEPLRAGLALLRAKPDHFKTFNPKNGWGDYDGFVKFVEACLAACEEYPEADVRASR